MLKGGKRKKEKKKKRKIFCVKIRKKTIYNLGSIKDSKLYKYEYNT
jgi:hypothetical protein